VLKIRGQKGAIFEQIFHIMDAQNFNFAFEYTQNVVF